MEVPPPSSALLPAGWRGGGGATPGRRSPGGMEESGEGGIFLRRKENHPNFNFVCFWDLSPVA